MPIKLKDKFGCLISRFLLIDIGKTKTVSAVVDGDLNVLGYGISGPADIFIREDIIKRNLIDSVLKSLKQCNCLISDMVLIVISWAGLDTNEQYVKAKRIVEELGFPIDKTHIIHDAISALYAVTRGKAGVAVIAGTGSIIVGIDNYGRTARSSERAG